MANGVIIALTLSVLLNLFLIIGYALIPVIRRIRKLFRAVFIGMGPDGVEIREEKIKGSFHPWKRRDGEKGDVHLDPKLYDKTTEGQTLIWVDTGTLHNIGRVPRLDAPKKVGFLRRMAANSEGTEAEVPVEGREEFLQTRGYTGVCENDDEETDFQDPYSGKVKHFSWPVWRRVTGQFLLRRRLDTRYKRMDDDTGLWETVERIAIPLMLLFSFVSLVIGGIVLAAVGGG